MFSWENASVKPWVYYNETQHQELNSNARHTKK
jgi:hypothetical protein